MKKADDCREDVKSKSIEKMPGVVFGHGGYRRFLYYVRLVVNYILDIKRGNGSSSSSNMGHVHEERPPSPQPCLTDTSNEK